MQPTDRRTLMKMMATAPFLAGESALAAEGRSPAESREAGVAELVKLSGDGLSLSPEEYLGVLQEILADEGIAPDYYSRGGVVEELEAEMARALGKESAVFFPTGTLANHVAARVLAGTKPRVIVPHDSHLYNDSGDCAQQLSRLNLVPLASESATFTLEQVGEVVERTRSGRVDTGVGAIVIESPVRRKLGEMFDYEEMQKICAFARDEGIGTHLDGARLYMASAYSGIAPSAFASHFDTVYVSLWKYFNAGSGAILAGPRKVTDSLYHTRRMFGGGLPGAWPYAAVALHFFRHFESDFRAAVRNAEELFSLLEGTGSFEVERIPNGSNIFKLRVTGKGTELDALRTRMKAEGVLLSAPRPALGGFLITVNASLNRRPARSLAAIFEQALA